MYDQELFTAILKVLGYIFVAGIGIIFLVKMWQLGGGWGIRIRKFLGFDKDKPFDSQQKAQDEEKKESRKLDEYHV